MTDVAFSPTIDPPLTEVAVVDEKNRSNHSTSIDERRALTDPTTSTTGSWDSGSMSKSALGERLEIDYVPPRTAWTTDTGGDVEFGDPQGPVTNAEEAAKP
jgi:hypothetical protein